VAFCLSWNIIVRVYFTWITFWLVGKTKIKGDSRFQPCLFMCGLSFVMKKLSCSWEVLGTKISCRTGFLLWDFRWSQWQIWRWPSSGSLLSLSYFFDIILFVCSLGRVTTLYELHVAKCRMEWKMDLSDGTSAVSTAMACFSVLFRHSPGMFKETMKTLKSW
jgi:hypothetical protein